MTALVIDLGSYASAAAVVAGNSSWLLPDPASGADRWPTCVHADGAGVTVGALAQQRGQHDPAGLATGFTPALGSDAPVPLGGRRFRPVELVAEVIGAMRAAAQRQHGPIDRVALTAPADFGPGDVRRGRLVAAAEAAGFGAVELVPQAVAAVSAPQPGRPFGRGDLVLVVDLGAGFEATVVRVGDADGEHRHEVIGHAGLPAPPNPQTGLDEAVSCCVDLLTRLGLAQRGVTWVLPVGAGCHAPGVDTLLERGLSAPVRRSGDPELTVVLGAAAWLPRSGPRAVLPVPANGSGERIMPLSYALPGGSGRLLRWLVAPQQPYREGQPLARVRLAGGELWELTARTRGALDQILVGDGAPIHSGDWLALARQ